MGRVVPQHRSLQLRPKTKNSHATDQRDPRPREVPAGQLRSVILHARTVFFANSEKQSLPRSPAGSTQPQPLKVLASGREVGLESQCFDLVPLGLGISSEFAEC